LPTEILKFGMGKWLGEDVSNVVMGSNMDNSDVSALYFSLE